MALLLTVLAVFILLVVSEVWWRKHPVHNEFSRKFVHITVGSFVAFWPFFLSWTQIELLSVAFLVVILISRGLGIFKTIHSVQRPTWGEVFFAIAVGLVAMITHHKGIYAAALLQMSLADGLAAIVGIRYGKNSRYKVLGNTKSVVGTATFLVVSLILLIGYAQFSVAGLSAVSIISVAVAASVIENLGVYGLDNILVPLLVAIVLTR